MGERRKPICGVVCECGPNNEPLACGYKPRHEGPHSWGTLPTFPLDRDVVMNEVVRVVFQHFGGAAGVPAKEREWLTHGMHTYKSDPNAPGRIGAP